MASQEKTEKPTAKKRRDERKEGHVALSHDVVTVASLLIVFYAIQKMLPFIYLSVGKVTQKMIESISDISVLDTGTIQALAKEIAILIAECTIPLLLISLSVVVISTGAQTRFLISRKSITFKLSNISPIQGIKKLFSIRNVIELFKNIIKIIIIGALLYQYIMNDVMQAARTMDMAITVSAGYMMDETMNLVLQVVLLFAVIAGFDFFYQKWEFEKNIKMTKEEIKEEYKQTEGDPQIKGKIRQLQRERAKVRMMQAVPTADVIIRNPTHYAVALKYDADRDNAPIVVAKGQDHLALRIIEIAQENGVYIIENKPLARGIYATAEVNQEISPEFYGIVAQILVEIYKLNHRKLV